MIPAAWYSKAKDLASVKVSVTDKADSQKSELQAAPAQEGNRERWTIGLAGGK